MNTEVIKTALLNAIISIETEQKAPLSLDQACVIHDLCTTFDIAPLEVLGEALNLIEPGQFEGAI